MKVPYYQYDGSIDEIEVSNNIGQLILDSRREEESQERKHRRHCYSLEAAVYEGVDYAADDDVQKDYETSITNTEFYEVLFSLTEIQKRRLFMLADGMSLREIARTEGVNLSKVQKTLSQIQKKFEKFRE